MTRVTLEAALQIGLEHHRAGRHADAESIYRQVLSQYPSNADALHLLGVLAHQAGRHAEACAIIERAIALNPAAPDYHYNIAQAYDGDNKPQSAEASYREALRLRPDHAQACNGLGKFLHHRHRWKEAEAMLRRAVEIDPAFADAHHNLSMTLHAQHQLDAAAESLQRAMELAPDAAGWNNLGDIRKAQGRVEDAIECFRKAIALEPNHATMHSNLLLAMNYHTGLSAQAIFDEHKTWAARHAAALYPRAPRFDNDRSPDRPLRVGYLSPDFKLHPVGFYCEPMLAAHRRENVEPYCYSNVKVPDALTQRMHSKVAGWRDISSMSDAKVADQIRADRIDILVDLAGHTAGGRMLVFARKPAPIQVNYLGYVNTSGLATMDYALTDQYLDPPGAHEQYRSERFIRLPRTYICYTPPMKCPDVGPLPAQRRDGVVTFACMNNFSKVSNEALDAWTRILQRVECSRLALHSTIAQHLDLVRQRFVDAGIDADRVEFHGKRPLSEYYALHNEFDIALDPFPHTGGTTTCDALWMGVPVITLAGEHACMRGGVSLLSTIGLHDLVADTEDRYIALAAELANDLPRLAELRLTMRQRMVSSPLMDMAGFICELEDAYRMMWRRWCKS